VADSRILIDTPATLSASFYDGETLVDPGVVTATVTRSDGTAVVTAAATTGTGAAARTYALPAQTRLDHLTAVWDAAARSVVTHHEIVGGYYAELAEIRSLDALTSTSSYPTSKLETARAQAEARFEEATGVAWVPRHRREDLTGGNQSRLLISGRPPRSLIAVTIDGTPVVDLTTLTLYSWGAVDRNAGLTFPAPTGSGANVTVEYEYGFDRPPEDLKWAFLEYCRDLLLKGRSRIPASATVMSTDMGTFQLQPAGFRRTTGNAEVDAILNSYDYTVPGVAAF
jgi:hypothetical protein